MDILIAASLSTVSRPQAKGCPCVKRYGSAARAGWRLADPLDQPLAVNGLHGARSKLPATTLDILAG